MQKIDVTLPVKAWGSTNTKYRPSSINVGDDEFTAGSVGFETTPHGTLTKSLGGVPFSKTTFTHPIQDQYEAVFTSGVRHMLVVSNGTLSYTAGDGTFVTANSGYSATAHFEFAGYKDRVYGGNGISTLVYDRTPSYGGSTPVSVPHVMSPGCTAPATGPSAAAGSAGNVPVGSYFYKVTFLYYGEEESNGGPASTIVTVTSSAKQINLTSIPVGGYGVTAREIYRSDDGVVYRHVGEILDATTTTFTDNQASGDEQIPLDNGVPPAFSLILNHKDRNWMAGVSGQDFILYYSEAGFPDIVASDNFIRCNPKDPIVALVVYNDQILIFNRRSMGQVVGDTPDTFAYQELPSSVGCVDNRSIQIRTVAAVETNSWVSGGVPSVIWLSEKGVYEYNGSTIRYLSDKIEDILNINIQQVQQSKGQNAQSGTDFNSGTASGGVVLTGGTITTKNPTRTWETEADWTGGSSLAACAAIQTQNVLKTPLKFAPIYDMANADQTFTDDATITTAPVVSPGAIALGLAGTGSANAGGFDNGEVFGTSLSQDFTAPTTGHITSLTMQVNDDQAHINAYYFATISVNFATVLTSAHVPTSHAGIVAFSPTISTPISVTVGDTVTVHFFAGSTTPGDHDLPSMRYGASLGSSFSNTNTSVTTADSSLCLALGFQGTGVTLGLAGTGTNNIGGKDNGQSPSTVIYQDFIAPATGALTSLTIQVNDDQAHSNAYYYVKVLVNLVEVFRSAQIPTSHVGIVAFSPTISTPIPVSNGDQIRVVFDAETSPGGQDLPSVRYAFQAGSSFVDTTNSMTTIADSSLCLVMNLQVSDVTIPVGGLTLVQAGNYTGESHLTGGTGIVYTPGVSRAVPITVQRSGTLQSASFRLYAYFMGNTLFSVSVYEDAIGSPGNLVTTQVAGLSVVPGDQTLTVALSASLTPGTYWVSLTPGSLTSTLISPGSTASWSGGTSGAVKNGTNWTVGGEQVLGSVVFSQTPGPASGTWVSEVNDSHLTGSAGIVLTYAQVGYNPAQATTTVSVAQSDDVDFTTPEILTISNPNGSPSLSFTTTKRYWQIEIDMATTDDRYVPVFGLLTLSPPTTTTWESEAIDCTSDVTAYSALTPTKTTTGSGTFAVLAASSANGSSYSSWDTLANTTVRRYIKFQITLTNPTNTAADLASVTALEFGYEIVANLVSAVIDTGVVPAGWDVFQSGYLLNGGTVTWYLRSAATSGGISAASYTAVVPGEFPATTPLQYAQWKVVVDSTANRVPVVSTVTLKWFIGGISTVRAASLFYNRNYYLAVAELGQPANNLVVEYDWSGNWRIREDISASTMGFYYSDPYYGSVSPIDIARWLYGPTNFDGSNIPMDVRTKAFDFGTNLHPKVLRKLFVTLGQTGATWTFSYSLDGGQTFLPLYDSAGNTTVSTSAIDGGIPIVVRLVPAGADLAGAKTIMFRAFTNDAFTAELHEMAAGVMVRKGDILRG